MTKHTIASLIEFLPQQYVERFPLAALVDFPGNPKDHDIGVIDDSMKTNGFYGVIVAMMTEPHYILAGHGRKETLLANGQNEAPVLLLNCDMRTARRIVLVDNRASEAGGFNPNALAEFLVESANADDLRGTGYDRDDVQTLLDELNSPLQLNDAKPEIEANLEDGEVPQGPQPFLLYNAEEIVEDAFRFYRMRGFPYKHMSVHAMKQELNRLASLTQEQAVKSILGYGVADTFHPHRFHAHAQDKFSPLESFNDDRRFRAALNKQLEFMGRIPENYFGWLSIVQGTQACANFRPGYAMHLYRRFAKPGARVLDPCTGYGGRLVGWIASMLGGSYVGCDPNTPTHEANERLARMLAPASRVELYNLPAEDALPNFDDNEFDFAFTSPPYFAKELYASDDTQSWVRYPTIEEWRGGFLSPLMTHVYRTLKTDAVFVVNIADVKIKNVEYDLTTLTISEAVDAGFMHEDTLTFEMSTRVGKGDQGQAVEPAFVFRKPVF